MVVDLRQHVAELAVVALFAVAGFVAVCWLAAGAAERVADWWRDRHPFPDEDELRAEADEEMAYFDEPPLGLPPERTWEQMTSHQLPLTCVHGWPGESCGSAHPYQSSPTSLSAERERRPPAWETDHRAHYVAMGFDYPSGLMARVRELAP